MSDKELCDKFSVSFFKLSKKIDNGNRLTNKESFALRELVRIAEIIDSGIDPGAQLGISWIQNILGISRPVLTEWRQEGFPGSSNHSVDAGEVIKFFRSKWVSARDQNSEMGPGESESLERYRAARAEQEEIKLYEKKGQLVDTQESIDCISKVLSSFWGQIQILRDKLPPILARKPAKPIRNILIREFNKSGEEIIETLKKLEKNGNGAINT